MDIYHQIIIIGGGNGGLSVAAQLLRKDQSLDIAIIEPSEKHYYQPAWTMVGGVCIF
jgi:sulfide:quinone oxidoreductase